MEEQKRNGKCSIQRAHVLRTIIHWISMQAWDCRGQWRWTCVGGSVDKQSIWTPTHSPKARHFLFTVASGKEEAPWKKNMKKKNLKTTTGSRVGGRLRMCRYPVCFGVHFCVKFQYLGGKLPSRRDPVMILKTDVKILCVTVRVNSLVIRSAFKKKEKRKS